MDHVTAVPARSNTRSRSNPSRQSIAVNDHGHPTHSDASDRLRYLLCRENSTPDIRKLNSLLRMPQVLLEIGCGDGEAARQIALKNPGIGVIATDLYDWS
ncbi:MAG: hypothetical protein V2I40_08885, partial [Desulfobacteraceae bacterium]|nr:hypothetical protein [Desulfobacteraceae bacterium]